MTSVERRFSLQTILAFDAATCAGMGILLTSASGPIAQLTAIPGSLLFLAGLLLLPIAVFIAIFAHTATVPSWAVHLIVAGNLFWIVAGNLFWIVAGNLFWVLGSVLLPVVGLIAPNALGWPFLLMQVAVVTLFAGLEWTDRTHSAVIA